jgi:hypothetical protein
MKLTAHSHLVPRLRMHEVIPPLPQMYLRGIVLVKHRDNFTLSLPAELMASEVNSSLL